MYVCMLHTCLYVREACMNGFERACLYILCVWQPCAPPAPSPETDATTTRNQFEPSLQI